MKRIAIVGAVGAGKTTLFNALQGNYSLARKTQALEFNDRGDIDTPGEYFSHPRWYHALITTLQDVDTLIYVHAANDTESRLPPGLLDIGSRKHLIVAISKPLVTPYIPVHFQRNTHIMQFLFPAIIVFLSSRTCFG